MANRGVNKVILVGYLGKDPEIRYMSNGGIITKISVATTKSWKDKRTNELKENTEWHRVVLFGKLAEIASKYLRKGSQIYVEGSLQTRKWQDQNGLDRYITEVLVNVGGTMQMLGIRTTEDHTFSNQNQQQQIINPDEETIVNNSDSNEDFDDDIPF